MTRRERTVRRLFLLGFVLLLIACAKHFSSVQWSNEWSDSASHRVKRQQSKCENNNEGDPNETCKSTVREITATSKSAQSSTHITPLKSTTTTHPTKTTPTSAGFKFSNWILVCFASMSLISTLILL